MLAYVLRRLLLMIPTLAGIMIVNFALVQFLPGGPVEQVVAQLRDAAGATDRIAGGGSESGAGSGGFPQYQGARGLPPGVVEKLERQFGFDRPPLERFVLMMGNYLRFDFGESYFRSISVVDLVLEKMPVSITLGLWSTLLAYLVSIPLGIRKAVRDGSRFDTWTSGAIVFAYAIPGFLFAILLLVLFAGGSYFKLFPLRGLVSEDFAELSAARQGGGLLLARHPAGGGLDDRRLRHPDPAHQEFVPGRDREALRDDGAGQGPRRGAGALRPRVPQRDADRRLRLSGPVHRHLLHRLADHRGGVLAGRPGKAGFEAAVNRDYPVLFGTLYVFGLLGLLVNLLSDITYVWIDPRIDFETRET